MTPRIGREFVDWRPGGDAPDTLGVVGFSIFPHLDFPGWADEHDGGEGAEWAARLAAPRLPRSTISRRSP